jgi:hypothetical protein
MTAEEAIKLLHPATTAEALAEIECYGGFNGKQAKVEAVNTACLVACEALEKQIPKKPTRGKYGHTECACCGWLIESFCGDLEQYPFCPNCGQAIDWED